MANLVLRPQVTAFLDTVTTATGPDLHIAEIEVHTTCPQAGKTIRDIRVRHETGAIIVALRKRDGSFDTTPEPDVAIEPGDVIVGVGTTEELQRLEDLLRGCRLIPSTELAESIGPDVELERPTDAAHGDFATNAALQLAGRGAARRASSRRSSPGTRPRCPAWSARRSPAQASSTSSSPTRGIADALAALLEAGAASAAAGRRAPASASRSRWCPRTRPARSPSRTRATAPTATAVARLLEFAGHEVEREYYYNDSGGQMDRFRASVEAVRRGEEPPEDGYRGDYVARARRRCRATPCREMLAPHRGIARAVPHPLRLVGAAERGRAASAGAAAAARHIREGRRGLGAVVGVRRRGGPRAPPLRRPARRPIAPPTSPTWSTSSSAASTAAIYVLGADHHGTRNWYAAVARMLGYDPGRVEVLLYQLVHLTKGGEHTKMSKRRGDVVFLDDFLDEIGVDAARWYLVNRGPDQTIEIDVDLAAERSQKNPVYYVQYAHARIAGILRNAGADGASSSQLLARAPRPRGARAREAAARASRGRCARRPSSGPRRRSRPMRFASPTTSTASTTSTACSRATSRRSGSPSAARRRR